MQKIVTLACAECGDRLTFKVGADKSMATLNDILVGLEESKERNKILEWMVKTQNALDERAVLTAFDNLAETLCAINYDALGARVKLFDGKINDDTAIKRFKASDAIEKLNVSKLKWIEILRRDGVVAFNAIYYCRKCKKLSNRVYLRVHSTVGKEFTLVLPYRCEVCKSDLELVDDENLGLIYTGLETAVPCGCGKANYCIENVNFSCKTQEKTV